MAIVNCGAYTCFNNKAGTCQLNNIQLIDKDYYDNMDRPVLNGLCCDSYKYDPLWKVDNTMPEEKRKQWEQAIKYARKMLEEYKKIPGGLLGAVAIQSDISLYENGDRSEALLESLESIC